MVQYKRVKASDVIGNSYYIYKLTSSNYNPSLNGSITITCTVTNIYGQAVSGKSITLYQNTTSKGAKTTDSNGVQTWSITCSSGGLQTFRVEDGFVEVFVDNKAEVGHSHSGYLTSADLSDYVTTDDSRLSDARTPTSHTHTTSQISDFPSTMTPSSHTHGNLQNNGQVGSTAQANKNVVTNSSGLITTEDKPTIPSASSTTPSADTTSGSVGTGTTWARSNHTHPKSSLYAEATHNHTKSQITDFPTIPSKTSDLTNDTGFLTSHQDISGKLDKSQTSYKGKNVVVDSSSGNITFEEKNNHTHSNYLTSTDISGKIDTAGSGLSKSGTTLNHSNSITALTTASFKKIKYDAQGHITGTADVSASDLPSHTHNYSTFSGSYNDLTDKPNIPSAVTVDTTLSSTSNNPIANSTVNTALGGKAPTSHASSATTYGVGTTSNYGHVKTINGLTQSSHSNGTALSAYQGYVLKQAVDGKADSGHTHSQYLTEHQSLANYVTTSDYRLSDTRNPKSTKISAGSDINTYTTTGFYYNNSNTDCANISNLPESGKAFFLLVEDWGSSNYTKQTITHYGTGKTYTRIRNQGTWGSWKELLDVSGIVDNLTSTATNVPLSAKQGKVLNETKANKSEVVDWDNITFVSKTDDSTGSIILNFLS